MLRRSRRDFGAPSLAEGDQPPQLTDQVLNLGAGRRVGVTMGGRGVPLVFMPGLGYGRQHYRHMLQTAADRGFLVIGIDGAGHGDSAKLRWDKAGFASHVQLTVDVLDALGMDKVVVGGHSIGGRLAIELAARVPHRTLALVLINAAGGAYFDQMIQTALQPPLSGLRKGRDEIVGSRRRWGRDTLVVVNRYARLLALLSWVASGQAACGLVTLAGWMGALARSMDSAPMLEFLTRHDIPTFVVHGEHDRLVPLDSAHDMAHDANAQLYVVPRSGHSWLIRDPQHGAEIISELIDGALGQALVERGLPVGVHQWTDHAEPKNVVMTGRSDVHRLAHPAASCDGVSDSSQLSGRGFHIRTTSNRVVMLSRDAVRGSDMHLTVPLRERDAASVVATRRRKTVVRVIDWWRHRRHLVRGRAPDGALETGTA